MLTQLSNGDWCDLALVFDIKYEHGSKLDDGLIKLPSIRLWVSNNSLNSNLFHFLTFGSEEEAIAVRDALAAQVNEAKAKSFAFNKPKTEAHWKSLDLDDKPEPPDVPMKYAIHTPTVWDQVREDRLKSVSTMITVCDSSGYFHFVTKESLVKMAEEFKDQRLATWLAEVADSERYPWALPDRNIRYCLHHEYLNKDKIASGDWEGK